MNHIVDGLFSYSWAEFLICLYSNPLSGVFSKKIYSPILLFADFWPCYEEAFWFDTHISVLERQCLNSCLHLPRANKIDNQYNKIFTNVNLKRATNTVNIDLAVCVNKTLQKIFKFSSLYFTCNKSNSIQVFLDHELHSGALFMNNRTHLSSNNFKGIKAELLNLVRLRDCEK